MNQNYNQDYTELAIHELLNEIKQCVRRGNFIISSGEKRKENQSTIRNYRIDEEKQIDILLGIEVNDFCHSLQNIKEQYSHEVLYVFCPLVIVYDISDEEIEIDLYIKFNLIERNDKLIVISFHERNKPIDYAFK